jgi:Crinkler effector protein N-terminal domain
MTDIIIFCLVHGEPIANAFPVEIPRDGTIGTLKKLIKTEKTPEFNDIAADKLKLWSVNIPIDDTAALEELTALEKLENNEEKGIQELLPVKKIRKIFPNEPTEEHIHIIIERPSYVCK